MSSSTLCKPTKLLISIFFDTSILFDLECAVEFDFTEVLDTVSSKIPGQHFYLREGATEPVGRFVELPDALLAAGLWLLVADGSMHTGVLPYQPHLSPETARSSLNVDYNGKTGEDPQQH